MKTTAAALSACALLAALVGIERFSACRAEVGGGTVERLVAPERLAGNTTAAFTLESNGSEVTYLRSKGLWRCREAFGAVCPSEAVGAFLEGVLGARGTVVCAGPDCAARAGLDAPGGLRLSLHGTKFLSDPQQDTFVEIAFAPPTAGATFAAVVGTERVLAIDRDPRPFLDTTGRPAPLVDTRVLAGCFAPEFAGFERMFVDRGASSIELVSAPGSSPDAERNWQIVVEGVRKDALLWRVGGYVSLWVRLRWDQTLDPRERAALGLEPPLATITLAPNVGSPFEIAVSAPATNRVHLWNRATNVVASVRAELLPLLVPDAADFTRVEGGNPWEAWLAPR
jgi:hypothetical protein